MIRCGWSRLPRGSSWARTAWPKGDDPDVIPEARTEFRHGNGRIERMFQARDALDLASHRPARVEQQDELLVALLAELIRDRRGRSGGRAPVDAAELVVRQVLPGRVEVATGATDRRRTQPRLQQMAAPEAQRDLVAGLQCRVDLHVLELGDHRLTSGESQRTRGPDRHRSEPESAPPARLDLGRQVHPGVRFDPLPMPARRSLERRHSRVVDSHLQGSRGGIVERQGHARCPAQPQDRRSLPTRLERGRSRCPDDVEQDEREDQSHADGEDAPRCCWRDERCRPDSQQRDREPPSEIHA